MRSLLPGHIKDGKYQMAKESTVTEDGDAMFRSSFHIAVAGEQICHEFLCAPLTLLFRLKGSVVPPAGSIHMIRKN